MSGQRRPPTSTRRTQSPRAKRLTYRQSAIHERKADHHDIHSAPRFRRNLPYPCQPNADTFTPIGQFHLNPPHFTHHLTTPDAATWLHSLYAWVSRTPPHPVLRIGKAQGPLAIRLAAYRRSLSHAMHPDLPSNTHYKGDTPPGNAKAGSTPSRAHLRRPTHRRRPGQLRTHAHRPLQPTPLQHLTRRQGPQSRLDRPERPRRHHSPPQPT